MKVTVCIGSYCHLKGSRTVAERLRERIAAAAMEAEQEEEIVLINELPGTQEGYGFEEQTPSVTPEATLPPRNP